MSEFNQAQTCDACGAAEATAFICGDCSYSLHRELLSLPELLAELGTERAKKSVKGSSTGGGGGDPRAMCPVNFDAADLIAKIESWLRRISVLLPVQPCGSSPARQARCLACNTHELALRPDAAQLLHDVRRLSTKARNLIDLPLEKYDLGVCVCGKRIIAPRNPESPWGGRAERVYVCRNKVGDVECGTEWLVEERIALLADVHERQFEDNMLTPRQIEVATGGRLKFQRVRNWIDRDEEGKLVVSIDSEGRTVVRFGDVLDREAATNARRSKTAA